MDPTIASGLISAGSAIIVCVISGAFALKNVTLTLNKQQEETQATLREQNAETKALMEYRLTELEKKVDKHNSVIERMTKAEVKIADLETRMDDLK